MKYPCVHFTDLHLDDYKAHAKGRDRLEDCLQVLNNVFALANKKGAKHITFSGDLYNTVKFLATVVVNRTIARFSLLFRKYPDIALFAITGNHDFATKNLLHKPTVSALEHLATIFPDNFILIDNKTVKLADGIGIAGIPNYEYKEHYQEKLAEMSAKVKAIKKELPETKVTLMIHQKPNGNPNPNVRIDTDVTDPLYDVFDMVICGDIHTSKLITDKFLLPGNPLHRNLEDEGLEKGIWLYDLADPANTMKFVSRKGRYPEFIRVQEGDDADDPDNFIIVEPTKVSETLTKGTADVTKFSSALSPVDLVTNFWEEQGEGNKKLLAKGLSFLEKSEK